MRLVAGLAQVGAGALLIGVSLIADALRILEDIAGGNWQRIGADARGALSGIAAGVSNLVGGLPHALEGLFQLGIGAVRAALVGFIGGVLGFFGHLLARLVGHSSVPDLLAALVARFVGLPGRALVAQVGDVLGDVLGLFGRIKDAALASVTGLIGEVAQVAFGALPPRVTAALQQAAESFMSHARDQLDQMAACAGQVFDGLLSSVKNLFGSHSPSQVFAEIGADVGAGFVGGLDGPQRAQMVTAPALRHFQAVIDAARVASAPGQRGGLDGAQVGADARLALGSGRGRDGRGAGRDGCMRTSISRAG